MLRPMDTIDTARLHLRPLDGHDEALYCSLYTDPAVMRHVAAPMSAAAAQRSFAAACRLQQPRVQRWIVREREAAVDIGLLGLVRLDEEAAELGVMLLGPWHGRGYATEAMAGLRDHAFAALALQRLVVLQATAANAAVSRMMPRLDFARIHPHPGPDIRWELHREDWRTRVRPAEARPPDGKLPVSPAGNPR